MFRAMKNDDKLAGFILDNRSNSGGYNTDMNFILGNMISEPVTVMETRVKEGIGYTPDYVVNRKDCGTDCLKGLTTQLSKAIEIIKANQKAKD